MVSSERGTCPLERRLKFRIAGRAVVSRRLVTLTWGSEHCLLVAVLSHTRNRELRRKTFDESIVLFWMNTVYFCSSIAPCWLLLLSCYWSVFRRSHLIDQTREYQIRNNALETSCSLVPCIIRVGRARRSVGQAVVGTICVKTACRWDNIHNWRNHWDWTGSEDSASEAYLQIEKNF